MGTYETAVVEPSADQGERSADKGTAVRSSFDLPHSLVFRHKGRETEEGGGVAPGLHANTKDLLLLYIKQ